MKKIIALVLVAAVMFGASAAASWKLRQSKIAAATESHDTAGEGSTTDSASETDDHDAMNEETASAKHAAQKPRTGHAKSSFGSDRQPAAIRTAFSPSVEDAVQLAASLRDRVASVRERELQLVARQKQLELIAEDIRNERAAIDELRKQVSDEMKAAEERLAEVDRRFGDLDVKQQDLAGRVTEIEGSEKDNFKKMGTMYDSMAPESAAKILQTMADSGMMDTAVKVLASMKERQAAKVMTELLTLEPSLAAQISEKLKGFKRPLAQAKK